MQVDWLSAWAASRNEPARVKAKPCVPPEPVGQSQITLSPKNKTPHQIALMRGLLFWRKRRDSTLLSSDEQ